jgi:hypothetical protein
VKLVCPIGGEVIETAFKPTPEEATCSEHGCRGRLPSELKPRKPLARVSEKRTPEVRRRGSTLKRGRGLAASPEQQRKVRDLPCIVCGKDRHEAKIEAAHVYPRRLASCDCADGVAPLCHDCQRAEDANELDLLPALLAHGYRTEVAHAFLEHDAPLREVLEQVTGTKWQPIPTREAA